MNRMGKKRRDFSFVPRYLPAAALFLVVAGLFFGGLGQIDAATETESLRSTEQAIRRASVHCYAVEGAYPPDLAYLEGHYGLMIDHARYTVHYECFAQNIMPDISVFPKQGESLLPN